MKIFVVLVCCFVRVVFGIVSQDEGDAAFSIEAVQGGTAKLPCNITPELPADKTGIVIWFKEDADNKIPIYTFDSRDTQLDEGSHWADEKVLGARAYFRFEDQPAKLTLDNVRETDGGVYICRVDFKLKPTRNFKVNLTVIIPPERLSIIGEKGLHIKHYILGPYNEDESINITCVASGGRPPPRVTWWQENALLDDTLENVENKNVWNVLYIERLQRKHLNVVFTCQASNNNIVAPISSSVTLDINLRPLLVRITSEKKPLSAGNPYELTCEVVGARPEPVITWWLGSVQLKETRETTSPDRNATTSVLTFTPSVNDGGKHLSCRGVQPLVRDSGKEDGWTLDIHHVPLVTLELGVSLNGSTIKEGDDVYLECNIKSNPWVYKISWTHNDQQLYNNQPAGVIITNQSLVLQSATKERAGLYTCIGHNQEGDGESHPVQLDIKFAPVCRPGQTKTYSLAKDEISRIICDVDANPSDVRFTWSFNNSVDTIDIPQNQITADKTRSTLSYIPKSELDYGTLLCWGRNEIGGQKQPCIFHLNPAGKPDLMTNCTILNQTSETLHVECLEGFNGGLQQFFVMEVYDALTKKLVSNVTSRFPVFLVGGLESGVDFDIQLYAANKKGRSSTVHLQATTLKAAEKHTALAPVLLHINPILGSLIGVVATLIFVAVAIVVIIRLRRNGDDDKEYPGGSLAAPSSEHCPEGSTEAELLDKGSVDSLEDKNPDIVPSLNVYVTSGGGVYTLKKGDEVAYAQLQHLPHQDVYQRQQAIPMAVIRRQLDLGKEVPQPLSPTFHTLNHPNLNSFLPGPVRSGQHVDFALPLINTREESDDRIYCVDQSRYQGR